jgi:hypothetical protein
MANPAVNPESEGEHECHGHCVQSESKQKVLQSIFKDPQSGNMNPRMHAIDVPCGKHSER